MTGFLPAKPASRVALITLYHDNYQSLADVVLPNLQAYCNRHSYSLRAYRGQFGPGAIGFQKMLFVLSVLFGSNDFDLALVTDLDICITNLTIPIETFSTPYPDHDYLVTKDVNGINNGAFIVRRTPWARGLLEAMVSFSDKMTNEQDVLKNNEATLVAGRLKVLPHPSLNGYRHSLYAYLQDRLDQAPNEWKPGDFLLHLPGISLEQRLSILNDPKLRDQIVS